MTFEQIILTIILTVALFFFISGILRYDLVASLALMVSVFLGLIPLNKAFIGFSNSAVITVAAIFVISRAVENTGILGELSQRIRLRRKNIPKQILMICAVVTILSAFMNNVGAVALMIPVTLKIARIKNIPRGALLMPLAFSSLLGGVITLIGTPPNIIISDFRRFNLGEPYYFFDFAPVGLVIAILGILYMAYGGWKLIPLAKSTKKKKPLERFTVELIVRPNSSLINRKIASLLKDYAERIDLFAVVRGDEVYRENLNYYTLKSGDNLILQTDKWTVNELEEQYKLEATSHQNSISGKNYYLSEIIVLPQSSLCKRPISELNLPEKYGIEIIAVSRRNVNLTERLQDLTLEPGDGLLIKSTLKITQDKLEELDCIFFAEKKIRTFSKKESFKVLSIFGLALALIIVGILRVDVAFFSAAIIMIITKCISLQKAYQSIHLPIIVLIATLIPVGFAMESTGTAKLIAKSLYYYGQTLPISFNLFLLILVCMLLSNLINNAAVALIFAPIALQIASDWGASADSFLMGIAIGASCTFLTPIGHQSNTLILGPGRYRFSDYWRMGLPLSIVTAIIATLMIMLVWPFYPG